MYWHYETSNKSFLVMAKMLQAIGIKNFYFFLALKDEGLKNVDPFDETLSEETKARVLSEIVINPWYYLREVARMSDGDYGFELNIGSLAAVWSLLLNIKTSIMFPRQCYKSSTIATFYAWLINFSGINTHGIIFGNNAKMNTLNLGRIKGIMDKFPSYLKTNNRKNISNTESLKVYRTETDFNSLITKAPGYSEDAASNVGRGNSTAIQWYDEFAFIPYVGTQFNTAIHTFMTAAKNAEKAGNYHHIVMSTTAGMLSSDSGEWAHNFINKAASFDVQLLDFVSPELDDYGFIKFDKIRINSFLEKATETRNPFLHIEFNHIELGKDENYFKEKWDACMGSGGDLDSFLREVLNMWVATSANHPLGQQRIIELKNNEKRATESIYVNEFCFKLYRSKKGIAADSQFFVVGMDYSGNTGRDFSTFVVTDIRDRSVVCVMRGNSSYTLNFVEAITDFMNIYMPYLTILGERNFNHTIIELIDQYRPKTSKMFRSHKDKRLGIVLDKPLRDLLFKDILRYAVLNYGDKIYDSNIIKEITTIEYNGTKNRIDHARGEHDDTLMAYLYTMWFIEKCETKGSYIDPIHIDSKKNKPQYKNDEKEISYIDTKDDYVNNRYREIENLIDVDIKDSSKLKNPIMERYQNFDLRKINTYLSPEDSIMSNVFGSKPKREHSIVIKEFDGENDIYEKTLTADTSEPDKVLDIIKKTKKNESESLFLF